MRVLETILWILISLICPQMGLEEIKDQPFVRSEVLSAKLLGRTEPLKNAQRGVNKFRSQRLDTLEKQSKYE